MSYNGQLIDKNHLLRLVKKNAPFIYSILAPIVMLCPVIKTDKMRWVSVEEGLPEPFVSVLCYMPDQTPHLTIREGFVTNAGIWHAGLHERKPGEVVMWRAMPTPPKMKKKETAMVCPVNGAPCCECVPGAHCAKMGGGAENA